MSRVTTPITSLIAVATTALLAGCATTTTATATPPGTSTQAGSVSSTPVRGSSATIVDTLHPYQPGVDVEHYDFRISLPARGKLIRGAADITVRRDLRVDTLRLDLLGLTVHGVDVGGVRRAIRRDSARLHIPLLSSDGPMVRVRVSWEGEPTDGLIIREDAERGWSAFGDNWPNRARHWLPTVDHPSDKATVSWTITAPSSLAVVANGVQQSRSGASGSDYTVSTFTMRQRIPPHLMVLGAARMTETTLGNTACGSGVDGACVPQSVWTFQQETSYAPGPFARAGDMIEYFARTAGSYPYERLAHLQSATRFGGMENATAIFYSDNAFRQRNVGLGLIAHETVHQWFGNAVTPRRWQDLWLSEGFASYWAPLYLGHAQGDSVFRVQLREMRATIIAAPVVAQRPVVDTVGALTPMELLNANSYQKGGWVLHMLRADVGDSVFFASAREYQRIYRHGTATTDNFLQVVERNAGRSLRAFAAQWLHRPGWAELTINAAVDPNGRQVTLDVTQGTKFGPFNIPLTLLLRDAAGKESRVRVVVAAEPTQRIVLNVEGIGRPTSIVADPDVQVLGTFAVRVQ